MKNKSPKEYAVLWASSSNIGDDIQTLAAINFLKKRGINKYTYIDRERFKNYDGPPVKLIMNGWFTTNLDHFPPSEKITPIFISFHTSYERLVKDNIKYFERYAPIGCRDEYTVSLFKKHNVKAYFTGCLTLSFDEERKKGNKKYIVDISPRVFSDRNQKRLPRFEEFIRIKHNTTSNYPTLEQKLVSLMRKSKEQTMHMHSIRSKGKLEAKDSSSLYIKIKNLKETRIINYLVRVANRLIILIYHFLVCPSNERSIIVPVVNTLDYPRRIRIAKRLLNRYKSAKLVVTTRLHCVLPCRAFNTDTIFIHEDYYTDPRFKGLEKYINGSDELTESISNTSIDRNLISEIRKKFDSIKL